jgi:replication initiation protein RepC
MGKRTGAKRKVNTPQASALSPRQILERAGLQHITLPDLLKAASPNLKAYLPLHEPDWSEFIEGAYQLKNELNISQASWSQACAVLGRSGAAICVLLTDLATHRESDPVRKPAAYFAAMIERARTAALSLDLSIKAIIA